MRDWSSDVCSSDLGEEVRVSRVMRIVKTFSRMRARMCEGCEQCAQYADGAALLKIAKRPGWTAPTGLTVKGSKVKTINTDVVVIGGGSTGAGVVRDVAMRGFRSVLVDRADIAQGTSGRFHGLLHSGGRYVASDPESATECAEENLILKRINANSN